MKRMPLYCGECGAPVTSISRGRQVKEDGTIGPIEPAKFGCGHLAGEVGQLVQTDLTANAPGPEAYWPETKGVVAALPEPTGPTPIDPGWLTGALSELYREYRSIEPWKGDDHG